LSCCTIWHEKKNCCLFEGWGVNIKTMIATWKAVVNYEILSLGEVSKEFVLDMISLKRAICYNEWKNLQRFEVCVYQVCTKGLAKVYHLAQKVKEI
jgi:hypothetical protein